MKGAVVLMCALGTSVPALAQSDQEQKQVTVTGCVSMNQKTRMYVLTASREPLARATGGVADEPTSFTYQLVGDQRLQNHTGHRIEVTGSIVPHTTASAESESETTAKPTDTKPSDPNEPKVETRTEVKVKAQTLKVESFRHIASSCSPTGR
jgi:hypothetical protein